MILLKAPAKVNLYLQIVGKEKSGYHLLDSLVYFSEVSDVISIAESHALEFKVVGRYSASLLNEASDTNLIIKAIKAFCELTDKRNPNWDITLTKNIPIGAGLGGGSSDAAVVIKYLNQYYGNPLTIDELKQFSKSLGADIPVCIDAVSCFMSGIGDITVNAPPVPKLPMLLIYPRKNLPTKDVYNLGVSRFTEFKGYCDYSIDLLEFVEFLKAKNNDLEEPAFKLLPELPGIIKTVGTTQGCLLARMSGSGSSVYAIFENDEVKDKAAGKLAGKFDIVG